MQFFMLLLPTFGDGKMLAMPSPMLYFRCPSQTRNFLSQGKFYFTLTVMYTNFTLLLNRRIGLLLVAVSLLVQTLQAQQSCVSTTALSDGYSVGISNVTLNANGTYTITLTVLNNGCSGCKKLNSFLVQAAPGTYSNVIVQVLSGPFTYANIAMGPTLSGTSLKGFRINNTNGMGNGQASAFTVTYTVTTLQNQRVELKTSSSTLFKNFTVADFQAVYNCLNPPPPEPQVIFPYFEPASNKSYDIIGVELTSLYNKYANGGSSISDDIFQIIGSSVRISIRTQPGQHANATSLLTGAGYGLIQELSDPANNLINGTFPILNLLSLNQLPNLLVSARPIYSPINNAGLITSQGDTALRSFRARGVFGVDGTGIKVGVLSDSYNTIAGDPAADDVLRKDLPGMTNPDHPTPVQVLQDFPLGTRTDEGRAMLQIVHDVAPGAELAFRTGFLGPVDFAQGIRDLKQAGCNVIVDDITYISEPFFRDGVVAQAVDEVKAQGAAYFSAAGNFGTRSWQGTFAPVAAPAGVVGQAHNFAGACRHRHPPEHHPLPRRLHRGVPMGRWHAGQRHQFRLRHLPGQYQRWRALRLQPHEHRRRCLRGVTLRGHGRFRAVEHPHRARERKRQRHPQVRGVPRAAEGE
jgi:hypothetical protein